MSKMPYPGAEQYKKQNKRRRAWQKVVSFLACIVVFCTTYALILPAITMERDAFCGIEEHTHSEACYEQVLVTQAPAISCSLFTNGENTLNGGNVSVAHTHGASCYDSAGTCICPLEERTLHTHVDACYTPAHIHEDSCYTIQRGDLICQIEESEGHAHSDACYVPGEALICIQEETEGHTHSASCETKTLTCTLSTEPAHTHTTSCYQSKLICTQDEVAATSYEEEVSETALICESTEEGHVHDADTCYQVNTTTRTVDVPGHTHSDGCYASELACGQSDEAHAHGAACYASEITCGQEEYEGHTHGPACYEPMLNCEIPVSEGHAHGDACYVQNKTLICEISEETQPTEPELTLTCGMQELILHTHTDLCASPCTQPEVILHTHEESCFTTTEVPVDVTVLTCTQPESEDHTHNFLCYGQWDLVCELEEHTHEDSCYSDPNADVETAAQWEATFAHIELMGDWNQDVLAIAKTQLGYRESEKNYALWEDGSAHGYTRYGAWYGSPYGDWCAMFVSFCLHYAEVEGMPLNWGVRPWIEELTELELYHVAAEYTPQPGDLVFYDWEGDGLSDHVGLVAELIEATDTEPAKLKAIEGNSDNCVQYVTYDLSDPVLLGYSELPEPEETEEEETAYLCGLEAHTHDEACYGASGELVCGMTEHSHSEECETEPVTYHCGLEEHTHSETCYNEAGNLICTLIEHTHSEACVTEPESAYFCGKEAHTHSDDCYVLGILLCGTEEHTHTILCEADLSSLSEEDRAKVEQVIQRIEEMPSADEIDAKIAEFEEAEDYEGEEAWLTEVYQLVGDVYFDYRLLGEALQPYVINAEKLLELEYIWSQSILIDEIESAPPTVVGSSGANPVVSTSDFVKLNIYDYYGAASASSAGKTNINALWSSNRKYPGFQWNGGAYMTGYAFSRSRVDNIDFGNSMITDFTYGGTSSGIGNGVSYNFQRIGGQGGTVNQVIGYTNQPIGYSSGTSYDAMNHKLINGSPALSDGTSLSYLFSESNYAAKKNSANIDGLFRQNQVTGEYWYDSRENHAYYSNNRFTLYNQIITPNFILYPFGNFLPFNGITNGDQVTQVGAIDYVVQGSNGKSGYMQTIINRLLEGSEDATENQLISMLANYRNSLPTSGTGSRYNWTVEQAINYYFQNSAEFGDDGIDANGAILQEIISRLYNIDFDVKKNFLFGMDMEMNFMQPKDGMTGNDTNNDGKPDYPMKFYFAGDDDVWVYIDGILFLDLTGIHRHVGGDIDFVNGTVNYYMMDSYVDGAVQSTPYKTYTFAQILTNIGGIPQSELGNYLKKDANGNYTTLKDYTTHNFKFYYMERGTGSSVCCLNFNFPLLKRNSISVSKEVESDVEILGNPDYKFQVLKANSSGEKTDELFIGAEKSYTIYDANDKVVGTGTTDANGVFTLKAGQRAEFTGIAENAGKYYVRELLEGTVLEQYGNVTVSGESTTTSNNITVGSDTFTGMDSPVKDMSDGATAFRFTNDVDENKVGKLSVSKKLNEYPQEKAVKKFDVQVTLDGALLPVGTEYSVGTETRTVETPGIITIAADETALISNILAGTAFEVQETSGSAEGYTVTYSDSGGYTITVNDGKVSGIIKSEANVQLVVTNSEKGTTVLIPGIKSMVNPDGTTREYTFRLTEVTDYTGATSVEGGIKDYTVTAEVGATAQPFQFEIHYAEVDVADLSKPFYYKITEDSQSETLTNATVYVAEVTITRDETTAALSAEVTALWKNREQVTDEILSIDFENVLKGSLTLEKHVEGSSAGEGFTFEIELLEGTSGVEIPAETSYPISIYEHSTGNIDTNSIIFRNGVTTISDFKDGDKITISDIPHGTIWRIKEVNADGYKVTTTVTVGDASAPGSATETPGSAPETTGTVTVGGTSVVYTNTYLYELPETGGTGVHWYILGGIVLMTVSLGFLTYITLAKRRKEANPSP